MKKRMLLLAILLATTALAGQNLDTSYDKGMVRLTDFETDNVHILRLKDAATALGGNVTELKNEMLLFQEQRSHEIAQLQASMDEMQRNWYAQMSMLQTSIDRMSNKLDKNTITAAQVLEPEPTEDDSLSTYLVILLGVNIFLIFLVIILVIWLRELHKKPTEKPKEDSMGKHIHPAPPELIAYVGNRMEQGKKVSEIRMELAGKGWTPSIIEHAIHAAKEK